MLKISLKDLQSDYDNENKIVLDKPELQCATNERGHIIVDITTQKGDKIHARFVSANREAYSQLWIKLWTDVIKVDDYSYNSESGLVILKTSLYWDIYKRYQHGKALIQGTGRSDTSINGQSFTFPTTAFYFQKIDVDTNRDVQNCYRGVYGIKCGDELVYIGSSSTNIMERWREHMKAFCRKDITAMVRSHMYLDLKDRLDEISFILIYSDRDIADMMNFPVGYLPSTYLIQYTELLLIRAYKPKYNSEGIDTNFKFRGHCELDGNGIPIEYLHIIRDILTRDFSEYSAENIKSWIEGLYGEEVYKALTETPLRNDTYDEYLRSYQTHIF